MTQTDLVLEYMKQNGSITQLEAITELGVMRLGARIWDLKDQGVVIHAEQETRKNRYGKPVHYARYRLEI